MTTKEREDDKYEAAANKLLNRLKREPNFELHQELGRLLMRHIDDLSVDERKRYDELIEILKK